MNVWCNEKCKLPHIKIANTIKWIKETPRSLTIENSTMTEDNPINIVENMIVDIPPTNIILHTIRSEAYHIRG